MLRRDLIALLSNGNAIPAPPTGAILEERFSGSVALEYRDTGQQCERDDKVPGQLPNKLE